MSLSRVSVALLVCALLALPACKKKRAGISKSRMETLHRQVPGLDRLPAAAHLVLRADVAALKGSSIVKRAVEQMLRRDPGLRTEFVKLSEACEFDVEKDLKHVVVAMGGEHVVAVATGRFIESDIASCLNRDARASGGSFSVKEAGGRSYYVVEKHGHKRWLAVPAASTLVLATSEDWLKQSLAPDKTVLDNPTKAKLITAVDHTANLWGVAQVSPRPEGGAIGANLTRITGGQVKNPPEALRFSVNLVGGLVLQLQAQMRTNEDAQSVLAFIQLTTRLAKRWKISKLTDKMAATAEANTVTVKLNATLDELKETLSVIDTEVPYKQDKPGSAPGKHKPSGVGTTGRNQ